MVEGRRYEMANMLDLKPEDFDAVVIAGGFAPDILRREPKIVDFVNGAPIRRASRSVRSVTLPGCRSLPES